jgi:cytochrome P450
MTTSYNPFDPEAVDDQYGAVAELRREAPVAEIVPGAYYVSRYEDVLRVLHDPLTFPQGGVAAAAGTAQPLDRRALFELDPPEHTSVRRRFTTALSPTRVRALEPTVQAMCAELVDRFIDRGSADLVADFGAPLPSRVICRLVGFPDRDALAIRSYCDNFVAAVADPGNTDTAALDECERFERDVRARVVDRRQANTRPDDLLTALVAGADEKRAPLSDDRVLTHLTKDVLIGGLETTTHLIGNMFFEILTTEGLYARLRTDRALVAAAVEESLRHLSPVQVAMRRVAAETELAGTHLEHDAFLVLGLASANRDDAQFKQPDVYDVDRDPEELRQHLAFDRGIHSCVGAALVRIEAITALNAILDRIAHMELADMTYHRVRHFMMRGPTELTVTFTT